MKKTISINLAGLVYQIDDDAYQLLEGYLNKLRKTFTNQDEQKEILDDIEHRFAELFSEKLDKKTEVVTIKMVEEAIDTLGDIETIEEESGNNSTTDQGNYAIKRKLFRSTEDKIFGGVLGGLAAYFDIDAIWLRLIFVLLAIASVGIPVGIIYIILWLVMPKAETASQKLQMKGEPVNLSSIQDNIKKNFSSENVGKTGTRLADGFGEIFRLSAKTVALIIGAIISFKLVVFAFAWFFASFFVNFLGTEYLGLIFNNNWQFLLLSGSVFMLLALPFILAVFLLFKVVYKQSISWGKSFGVTAILWFLSLIITALIAFSVAKNFKVESVEQNYVELPLNDSIQELQIEFVNDLEKEDFQFVYKKGTFKSGGFEIQNKDLKMNTIFLQIEPSENDEYSMYVSKNARGKNKDEADLHLEKFSYNISVENGNVLKIPITLHMIDESKFRLQEMTYTLGVPIGTQLVFGDNAHNYIDDIPLQSNSRMKELDNNTWLMTINGLECLSCPEELEEEIEEDEDIEDLLEEYIEQEIKDALEEE